MAFWVRLRQARPSMTYEAREMTRHGVLAKLSEAPDLLVIAFWAALICCVAALRVNFIGDGVRHLSPILNESRPRLGEPRWLLFPAFLFAIIKPLQVAGLVHSAQDAVRVFLALDWFAGFAYLLLLRQWLLSRSVSPFSRAGALLIAGMTMPLLHFATDIVEAMVPATIALAGLAYLASRPPERVSKGLYVAAAAIAFAALLYQGTILALALIPCATPRGASVRMRTIVMFCAVLAVTPLLTLTALVAAGNNPGTAVLLIFTGEGNTLYRDSMASRRLPIWERPIAAISLGTARSIIEIPDNRGFRKGWELLSHRVTFAKGVSYVGGCLFALLLVAAGAVVVIRRRDLRLAIAFAGILILSMVRGYAYLKFYVLMPVLVALVAAISPPAIVLGAGAIVGYFNLTYLGRDFARDRQLAHDLAPLYEMAGGSACWLTTGWGPPLFGWPGTLCSMSHVLTDAPTGQLDAMIADNNIKMVESFRRCFCDSSAVYTDDVAVSSQPAVIEMAKHYRLVGVQIDELLWNPGRGAIAFNADGVVIGSFARPAQLEICASLKAASTNTSR